MKKSKKRMLIRCILGEILMAGLIVGTIYAYIYLTDDVRIRIIFILEIAYALFQMFILIPSILRKTFKK